jgi:hypothetical protein
MLCFYALFFKKLPKSLILKISMLTNFKTKSLNLFNKIRKYIRNNRIHSLASFENGQYVISVFNLNEEETEVLVAKMTAHFKLSSKSNLAA